MESKPEYYDKNTEDKENDSNEEEDEIEVNEEKEQNYENDLDNNEENNENELDDEEENKNKKNLNNETINDNIDLKENLNNINKGLNHKQEIFDLYFDSSFYSNRTIEVEKLIKFIPKDSNHGLTGLKNLKNTSFINSILQCLSHSLDFAYYLISKSYVSEINKNSKSNGTIINSLYSIINSLWTTNEKSIAPSDFKYNLVNYLPVYNNNNFQHDSSEFMFQLFDLLNEELNIKSYNLSKQKDILLDEINKKMESESDVQASKRFWNFHKEKNNSIITDLFHGQIKSTVNCLVCTNTAVYFEPFSSLILDIPDLKRIDLTLVSHLNLKPTINLTCFIPINTLFQDIEKFIDKYRNTNTDNEKCRKLKCLLVNTSTLTSRFAKLNDNVYQTSRKGNIVIYEIDEIEDGSDYYPYICMIRENIEKENVEKENPENKKVENPAVQDLISQSYVVEKKELSKKSEVNKENLNYNYKKKKNVVQEEKRHENFKDNKLNIIKNLSFPRLFNLSLDKTVRDIRISIYGFMRKYYRFDFLDLKNKYNELIKSNFSPLNQINNTSDVYSDPDIIKNLNDSEYQSLIEEEYTYIFETNYEEISKTEYIYNFPYCVKLVSAKDDLKFKILFSKNPEEFNLVFENELPLQKINQYIKIGYKLVLEINSNNKHFPDLKNNLNKLISIHPKDNSTSFIKEITLDDCLDNFCLSEKLERGNEWYCWYCKKNQNSLKKMELFYLPKNLIIILKRFECKLIGKSKIQVWKNNTLVKYPVNNLNFSKYINSSNNGNNLMSKNKDNQTPYDLYAISQHSGSLEGGHYASACRNFGKWYELDDQTVFPSDEETVVSPEGYILFYRRK